MSPFVSNSVKHHRRTPPIHVVRVGSDVIKILGRQSNQQDPESKSDAVEVLNQWRTAIVIGVIIFATLCVAVIVSLVKRHYKRSCTTPASTTRTGMNASERKDTIGPIIQHLGRRPPPLASGTISSTLRVTGPTIMVTPATASPSKHRFSQAETEDIWDLEPRLSRHSVDGSEPNNSEVDIAHTRSTSPVHCLRLYHDHEFNDTYINNPAEIVPGDDDMAQLGNLEEIDLHTPIHSPGRNSLSSESQTTLQQAHSATLAARIASLLAKRSSGSSTSSVESANSKYSSNSDHSLPAKLSPEYDLNDREIATLALQFPPPVYTKDGTQRTIFEQNSHQSMERPPDFGSVSRYSALSLASVPCERSSSFTAAPVKILRPVSLHLPRSYLDPSSTEGVERHQYKFNTNGTIPEHCVNLSVRDRARAFSNYENYPADGSRPLEKEASFN
ncbi:hypothetical protein FRC17_004232 [Serendipita sp. 399]|nr:hypothetical protein FRC17_004232 [Serendipita sp. 399]